MRALLIVHNTTYTNDEYKKKIIEKYPFLKESGIYTIQMRKLSSGKIPKRPFDTVYFDEDTITTADAIKYMEKSPGCLYLWVTPKKKQKAKLRITLPSVDVIPKKKNLKRKMK